MGCLFFPVILTLRSVVGQLKNTGNLISNYELIDNYL